MQNVVRGGLGGGQVGESKLARSASALELGGLERAWPHSEQSDGVGRASALELGDLQGKDRA